MVPYAVSVIPTVGVPDTATRAAMTVDKISQVSYLTNKRASVVEKMILIIFLYDRASVICINDTNKRADGID
jgi:hypothetical protein